jgi:rhomboid domain-containing protein 1
VWRCQSCTYDNSSFLETCDMCGAPRTSHSDDAFSPSAPPLPTPMSREELRQARLSRFYR